MNSNITPLLRSQPVTGTGHGRTVRRICLTAAIVLTFASVHTTQAQVTSINSAIIKPRVFDDIPAATLTTISNYPTEISFTEANVSSSTGYANRDVWYFSADGGLSSYLFQTNDYFSASFSVTVTGGTPGYDIEAGFLYSDPSTDFGGDLQIIAVGSGVVFQGGGPSYYPFSPAAGGYPGAGGAVPNYVEGETYTMGLNYVLDPKTGLNAFQYSVNGQFAASSPGNTYFDLTAGKAVGNVGDALGGYFQIQTVATNATNTGTAVFSNISITPNSNLNITQNGNQSVIYYPAGATNLVLQTSTNLASTNWTTVSNAVPITGVMVPTTSPATFFRLQNP
jgi:hypothetical protein